MGCGADSTGDPSTTPEGQATPKQQRALVQAARRMEAADPPLSKAQFIARVNAICRRAWPAIRDDLAAYRSGQDPQLGPRRRFQRAVARSLLPEVKSRIFDPMMALGTPEEGAAEVKAIMRWLGEAIEIGRSEFAITSPVLVWDLFDIFNPLTRRYGLGECPANRVHTGFEG